MKSLTSSQMWPGTLLSVSSTYLMVTLHYEVLCIYANGVERRKWRTAANLNAHIRHHVAEKYAEGLTPASQYYSFWQAIKPFYPSTLTQLLVSLLGQAKPPQS